MDLHRGHGLPKCQAFVSEVNCFLRDGISHSAQSYQARRQHCCVHPFKLPRPKQGQPTLAYTPNVKKKHYIYKYTHICGVQWSWVERSPSSLWSYLCKLLPSLVKLHLYRNSEDARTSTFMWGTGRQSCNSWETHRSRPMLAVASWQVFRLQNVIWHWNQTTPWYMLEKWCVHWSGWGRSLRTTWSLGFFIGLMNSFLCLRIHAALAGTPW